MFKKGYLYKLKTWKEMEEEFGLDRDGDISTSPSFVRDMEKDRKLFEWITVEVDRIPFVPRGEWSLISGFYHEIDTKGILKGLMG